MCLTRQLWCVLVHNWSSLAEVYFFRLLIGIQAYLFAVIGAEYILNMLPRGTHEYGKFIKPSELSAWSRAATLTVNEFKGMSYNPLTQHYWLGEDVSVNYMLHAVK